MLPALKGSSLLLPLVVHVALAQEIHMTEQFRQLESLGAPAEACSENTAGQFDGNGIRAECVLREATAFSTGEHIVRVSDELYADVAATPFRELRR